MRRQQFAAGVSCSVCIPYLYVSEQNGQLVDTTQEPGTPGHLLWLNGKPQIRHPCEQDVEGDLAFQPREWCPEAHMDPLAKGDVPVGFRAAQFEVVWIWETSGIAVS